MILGTQYYRPPFPDRKYWKDDFAQMRDAGLNTVQFWVCWGWVEPEPGRFVFDDYDELVAEAGKRGLGVVLSTIAAIQPFWILREIPDANMIDNFGHKVVSSCRGECNVGITPGGCTDHSGLRDRMRRFFEETVGRYAGEKSLVAWDIWNETRWAVNADKPVCYCPSTLAAFRKWLDERHGGLDGLNAAWKRRYSSWEDVFPGKLPPRPYTDMVEFLRFLAWRAREHLRFRYEAVRSRDKTRFVTAHSATPSTMSIGSAYEQALCRGNDWELADELEGFGCSQFPQHYRLGEVEYGVRLESVRSATRGKVYWVSELQGAAIQSGLAGLPALPADLQQRWVWSSIARGSKATVFWCWRDEVFGSEANGWGIVGNDGFAEERLTAMRQTGDILEKHDELLESYLPDDPAVGVLFEPDDFFLDAAQFGTAKGSSDSLFGYCAALERLSIPYEVVETGHLDILDSIRVLFMPWALVVRPEIAERIREFVSAGGTLLLEAETDAFTSLGFYRYPGQDRPFTCDVGVPDTGRRTIDNDHLALTIGDRQLELLCDGWQTPLIAGDAEILARRKDGSPLVVRRTLGNGAVHVVGTFLGRRYADESYPDFEEFVRRIATDAAAIPPITLNADPQEGHLLWRTGRAGDRRLLFVINSAGDRAVNIRIPETLIAAGAEITRLDGDTAVPASQSDGYVAFEASVAAGQTAVFTWKTE